MLEKIHISRFRGFEDFIVSNFKQFNIIAGKNNVGKSSLLEAIFLLSGMTIPTMTRRINRTRLMNLDKQEDVYSLFYQMDTANPVKIQGFFKDDIVRELELTTTSDETSAFRDVKVQRGESLINQNLYPAVVQNYRKTHAGDQEFDGRIEAMADKNHMFQAYSHPQHEEPWICVYLAVRQPQLAKEFIQKLINDREESYIVEVLKKIDNRILDLKLVGDTLKFTLDGTKNLLPVEVIGDGVLKVIHILSAMYMCKNGGLLCIDEIENGLHHTAMRMFWRAIMDYAKTNKIQVIATTHNVDMLEKIAQEILLEEKKSIKFFRMERSENGAIVTESYTGSEYVASINEGLELR